jgi:hypothetical protein
MNILFGFTSSKAYNSMRLLLSLWLEWFSKRGRWQWYSSEMWFLSPEQVNIIIKPNFFRAQIRTPGSTVFATEGYFLRHLKDLGYSSSHGLFPANKIQTFYWRFGRILKPITPAHRSATNFGEDDSTKYCALFQGRYASCWRFKL